MEKFVVVIDRESTDSRRSHNGGDYTEGRTIAIDPDGQPVAVRFWSSSDFEYCPHEGVYKECDDSCEMLPPASLADAKGWEQGQPLDPELVGMARRRLASGQFARIAQDGVVLALNRPLQLLLDKARELRTTPTPSDIDRHLGKYS